MLVVSRKQWSSIVIGDGITVTVLSIRGSQVRIGIEAPPGVCILRGEILATMRAIAAGGHQVRASVKSLFHQHGGPRHARAVGD